MHRLLRALEKHQRHPVTSGDADQFAGGTTLAELRSRSHNLIELLHYFALLVHEQSGVTHYVNKKDVRSFQVTCFFCCSSHRRDQLTHERKRLYIILSA